MKLCQLEFQSSDIEASLRFIESVLAWKKVPVSIQDQVIIEMPDDSSFGISIRASASVGIEKNAKVPLGPLAYFESDVSLTSLIPKILDFGGRILSEPQIVAGYGLIMIVEDPGGIRLGLYEARFEGPRSKP